jgi:hypothetical protein
MGLIEKRLVKQGQEDWVPEAEKELHGLTGGNEAFDVDWESFATDAEALKNLQYQGLRRINSAFRLICCDDLGKEAVNEKVTKICVKNVVKLSDKSIGLKEGVLTVAAAWGKGADGYFADIELKQVIEKLI